VSRNNLAAIIFLIVIIGAAFAVGFKITRNLEWPPDSDHYRDIASAQTMADGDLTADNVYADKRLWYNPLVPALVALINKVSGIAIPTLYSRAGAYLNLLAPISFSIMVWSLFGRRTAIIATIAFLFLINAHFRSLALATYSPWLFPVTFMQSFFYFSIALLFYIVKNQKGIPFYFLLGALTGITFLGHLAPTLLFAVIVTMMLALGLRTTPNTGSINKFGAFAVGAMLFSLPLIYFLVVVYRLRVLNYAPSIWLGSFSPSALIVENLNVALLIAAVGLFALYQQKNFKLTKSIITLWIISASVLLVYSLVVTYLARKQMAYLPALVPWFHFYFYLKAAETVLFGYGFLKLFELLKRAVKSPKFLEFEVVPVLIAIVAAVILFPSYINRVDLMPARKYAIIRGQKSDEIAAYHWIRKNTKKNDVFLATDNYSLFVINPAGRKTVCTKKEFSNPFVDFKKRDADRNQMFEDLRQNHFFEFQNLAAGYSLDYVISSDQPVIQGLLKNHDFNKAFEASGIYIFQRKTAVINGMLSQNSDMIL
jgi:hypothetical protein